MKCLILPTTLCRQLRALSLPLRQILCWKLARADAVRWWHWCAGLACLALVAGGVRAQEWLDKVDHALHVESNDAFLQADLSGLIDLEAYYIDDHPPGLIYGDDESFFNPRLSLFLDVRVGPHLYGFVQVRVDRGFDPRAEKQDARFDEYFVRWTPLDDARLNLQFGKFATVFGAWISRHDSWQNPFINAPLPYENVVALSDFAAPASPQEFLTIREGMENKRTWIPAVWGPSYASGASMFGSFQHWDYAVEIKNASLSSRPDVWPATETAWERPTITTRVGYRPNAAWAAGASFSRGAFFQDSAHTTLPPHHALSDYRQSVMGGDVSYARRQWQVWAEVVAARFEVPTVGDADSIAYFVEVRRKLTPRFSAAVRWNQQFFGTVPNDMGGQERWDRDTWRIESALTYRWTRHLQSKLHGGFTHQNGSLASEVPLIAGQLTVKF